MKLITLFKQHKLLAAFLAIAIISAIGITAAKIKNSSTGESPVEPPQATLIAAKDFVRQKNITLDNGVVESLGQADLRSQFSAPIARVNAALGSMVTAGQILVELKNDDLDAQMDQAKAGLAAAFARFDETKRGARPEDLMVSQNAADQAKVALVNAIQDAYAKSDDAFRNHIDKFFTNPREKFPQFSIVINAGGNQAAFSGSDVNAQRKTESEKYGIETMLENWQLSTDATIINSNLEQAVFLAKTNLQREIGFMNTMAISVNGLSSDNASYKQIIDGYKAEFSAARSIVAGSLQALSAAQAGWRGTGDALALKAAGATNEQIKQAQASVDQANAAVKALDAAIEKTIVRSPIAGRVSYLSARVGELATPGQLVASVVNPGALIVKTYASETDFPFISEGDAATVGTAQGTVRTVSPAVNPTTKKIEVNIALNQGNSGLVVGQTATVVVIPKKLANETPSFLIPIQAVRFSADGNSVFVVGQDSTIGQVMVSTRQLVGENVEVISGLDMDMKILSSVRGFKVGDKIKSQE